MVRLYSVRSRRAGWFCLIFALIAGLYFYGRDQRSLEFRSSDWLPAKAIDAESELTPTLSNVHELIPVAANSSSSDSANAWNPLPQWRDEVIESSFGFMPRTNSIHSSPGGGIPETYPLEPRMKNEPPTVGDALVQNSISKMAPLDSSKAWPDQNFAADSILKRGPESSKEISSPHLLTGAVSTSPPNPSLQPGPKEGFGSSSEQLGTTVLQSRPVERPSPPASNYILQPIRQSSPSGK